LKKCAQHEKKCSRFRASLEKFGQKSFASHPQNLPAPTPMLFYLRTEPFTTKLNFMQDLSNHGRPQGGKTGICPSCKLDLRTKTF